MSSLKNLTYKGTLRQVFICVRPRTPKPPFTHCIHVYSIFIHTGKGGGVELTREKGRRATVLKLGRKYQHDRLYLKFNKL
jgi:hypothetical protein